MQKLINEIEKLPNESWRDYAWLRRKDVIALIRKHEAQDGWKPMADVPDDLDVILGLCEDTWSGEGYFVTECHWCVNQNLDAGGWWERSDRNQVYPAYWMPLPAAPTTLQRTQGGDDGK